MDLGGPKEACVTWGHIGATWRIRLNRSCAAAMRLTSKITLTTCYSYCYYYESVAIAVILSQNTSGALYVVDQIEQLLRCVCVSVSLSVSGKQLSNDMALDLDIWHAASSLHYLRQIRSSNISHFTLVLPSSESL